ncbi:YbhB/YbcL family Raf kinase inhibitor-like protein [Actinomyces howellii]|nr:YbhB/YbcL family Raf kinase inhibitor-like protein [Actinomyces howellii]
MTVDLTRPRPPSPYDLMPALPSFTLASDDVADGGRLADRFTGVHDNISPELHWSGFPQETRSFVVSCFDPDAPTPAGWWHWTVQDLDVSVTSLPQGAGQSDLTLEGAAFHAANDAGTHAWFGPYPPAGDGEHRYVFAVLALDVETLGLDDEASPTSVAFASNEHCIARATLTATYSLPGEPGAAPYLKEAQ